MAEKTFHSITLPGQDTARVPLTAAEFSTSVAYKVKDYCTYQGKLYRCTTAHAAGAWNAAHFTETNIDAEFDRKLDIPISQASAPANPRVGDLWIDNDENSPIYNVDASPTLNSTNAVQSGGTKTALNSLDSRKMEHGVITGDFSASVDYRVGDLVFYATTANGITTRTLYRCTRDHNAAAWNATHFTATTLEVELQRVRDNEADTDMIGDLFGAKTTYAVGDYCIYNDNLYRCIQAVNNTGVATPAFDPDDWIRVALANDVSNLKNAINAIQDEIGDAPVTEIYGFEPNDTYTIIDTPQIKRFEDGKTYQLKVVIDSNVTAGTISLSTTSSSSGQYLYFKNNEAITAGTYYFTFTYSETVGHGIYLRLYLDATYTACSDVVFSVIDNTTIRNLINKNRVAIETLNSPVEYQITTFTPVDTYTVIDSPDLQRFKDGEKYTVYVTISEDVATGTISLSNSQTSSATVYTFVNAAQIEAGSYQYEFEYDETWTPGGLYLRLYLDSSYTKCSSVTIKKIEASNLRDYADILGNEISVLRDDPNKYKYAIDTVLCIGDSLTEGIYDDGTYSPIKQGYPYYIGRMVNTEVTNGGYNGYTAQRWYNDKANQYTYTNYNFIVIWLGTNGGLTDTLDTDVNPYTDYNDYADTNTGCYCKIIEKIKAENPHCMIMLCNCFAGTTKAVTNSVISKIADKYSLIVTDMSDMGTNNHPEWHNGTIPVHFGKAGYLMSAKRIIDTASAYFEEDPIRCEFGLSAFSRQ